MKVNKFLLFCFLADIFFFKLFLKVNCCFWMHMILNFCFYFCKFQFLILNFCLFYGLYIIIFPLVLRSTYMGIQRDKLCYLAISFDVNYVKAFRFLIIIVPNSTDLFWNCWAQSTIAITFLGRLPWLHQRAPVILPIDRGSPVRRTRH